MGIRIICMRIRIQVRIRIRIQPLNDKYCRYNEVLKNFPFFYFRNQIRFHIADPDIGPKINADLCESGSTSLASKIQDLVCWIGTLVPVMPRVAKLEPLFLPGAWTATRTGRLRLLTVKDYKQNFTNFKIWLENSKYKKQDAYMWLSFQVSIS